MALGIFGKGGGKGGKAGGADAGRQRGRAQAAAPVAATPVPGTATLGGPVGPGLTGAIAGAMPAGDPVMDGGEATFERDVLVASRDMPVVVDFWAPWCGPCKQLTPAIEKAVRAQKGKVRLVKVNVDENQRLAQALRIQSIPTVYAFFRGQPVDGFMGAVPESQVRQFIERLSSVAGPGGAELAIDAALAEAQQALDSGDAATAADIFQEVRAADPTNAAAYAGLARAWLAAGQAAQARALLDQAPAELARDARVQAARSALDLAEQARVSGPVAELKAKVAAQPDDHQARYDLALALYAHGQNEEAVDALLEIIRRERGWNEDAARKQLVKLFEAFGPTHPLTLQSRRRLSSLLFS